jgi:hypothetical protein
VLEFEVYRLHSTALENGIDMGQIKNIPSTSREEPDVDPLLVLRSRPCNLQQPKQITMMRN